MKKYLLTLAVISMACTPAFAGGYGDRATSIANANAQSSSASQAIAGVRGGNSVSNNTVSVPKQAPGFSAPGLAASGAACLGSVSGGASAAGFGASFGVTYLERNCEARAVSELLYRYGQRTHALRVLVNEHPMVRRAYAKARSGQ
jgi:hypothetical protein